MGAKHQSQGGCRRSSRLLEDLIRVYPCASVAEKIYLFMTNRTRWLVVALYAGAMAWVESAVVFYLRTMIDRIDPHQPNPLPMIGSLGHVELAREAATLIMLLTVGILAGRTWRGRLGYAAIAFGVWDIFYYVFLKVM